MFIERKQEGAGRRFYDAILMFKMLVLQRFYTISDEELEYQVCNRLDFQRFLGFPNIVPDYTTVWNFREYLSEANITDLVWGS